ncbi:MAG: serine/threonine protein kinase [Mycobacterium sp.]
MSPRTTALRAATAAALMGAFAVLGTTTAAADPATTPTTAAPADPSSPAAAADLQSPSPTASPGSTDDVNALIATVSKGYDNTNCTSQPVTRTGELAELQCGQSPTTGGPSAATYSLYANNDNLNSAFTAAIKKLSMSTCGSATELPTTWRNNSGQRAGQVACGTAQGIATVIWSTYNKNLLSEITLPNDDVEGIYNWWRTRG